MLGRSGERDRDASSDSRTTADHPGCSCRHSRDLAFLVESDGSITAFVPDHPFVAPAVRPLTTYFCAISAITITGSVITTAAAMSPPQSTDA